MRVIRIVANLFMDIAFYVTINVRLQENVCIKIITFHRMVRDKNHEASPC